MPIDRAASSYQLLNLSLADFFFDKPFAIILADLELDLLSHLIWTIASSINQPKLQT